LDTMASRYHVLPSEIMKRGDTLDVLVLDTALTWHSEQNKQAQAKAEGKPATPNIPVNKLKEMMEAVKAR